ncbi:MAG: pallilysin-related adhesin, partial [Spirochaetaceae bacterium]|nr:pallilysin-related adhesin [Spirochaetaceae bacterium]
DAVAVEETERSEGYHLGQTDGASWNILAYRRDKDSPNILDQVKETWSWDKKQGIYVKVSETDIPGAQVERDIVSKILTGSEKDFEGFLQGVWLESGKAPSDQSARILVFDRPAAAITFYTGEAQELFTWLKSDPTRYGLYARCKNVTVESLIRLMDIELTGADAIAVRIFEDLQMKVDPENRWDGSYRKLEQGSAETQARQGSGRGSPAFKLEGPYKAADGSEITFVQPSYKLKRGDSTERGSFGIYKLGADTVLDLAAMKDDGFAGVRKTYRATYIETKSGKDIVRRLVLAPARAAINGLEILEEPSQAFEQRIRG